MKDYYKVYCCPKCGESLILEHNALVCAQKHSYDIAQQGYVNLILAHQKSSLQSGDSKEMIRARDAFLEKGFYDFLVEELITIIEAKGRNFQHFLEIGCGSGFYLNKLFNEFQPALAMGSDVSKEAMKFGSQQYKLCHFSVNNSFHLQLKDHFFDLILSIFSPLSPSEIERVLTKSGMFLLVRPGEEHFSELYELLGMPKKSKTYPEFEELNLTSSQRVTRKIQLTSQDLKLLIEMTPLFWKTKNVTIDEIQISEITFDFLINVYE